MLLDLGLEFFFEALAHPLAAFGLDGQFQFAQRIAGACLRVHQFTFHLVALSQEEPIFPAIIMVVVSSSAQAEGGG